MRIPPQINHPVARSGGKAAPVKIGLTNSIVMVTKVRIFAVSEKTNKFVVGEVEHHFGDAIIRSGIKGSFWMSKAGKVGRVIDFGSAQLKQEPDADNPQYHRLVVAG